MPCAGKLHNNTKRVSIVLSRDRNTLHRMRSRNDLQRIICCGEALLWSGNNCTPPIMLRLGSHFLLRFSFIPFLYTLSSSDRHCASDLLNHGPALISLILYKIIYHSVSQTPPLFYFLTLTGFQIVQCMASTLIMAISPRGRASGA